ncbi:MAG: amidohydrolase family protein [Planctomycetota bacterium]
MKNSLVKNSLVKNPQASWMRALGSISLCCFLLICAATTLVHAEEVESVTIRAAKAHVGDGRVINNALIVITDGVITSIVADGVAPEGTKVLEVPVVTPGFIDANVRLDVSDAIYYPGEDPRLQILRSLGKEHLYHGGDVCPCGTACPAQMLHVAEESCLYCGWPEHDPHGEVHDFEEEQREGAEEARAMAAGVPDASAVVNEQSSEVVPHFQVLDALDQGSDDFNRLMREGVTTVYISPDSSAVIGGRGALMRTGGELSKRFMGVGAVKGVLGSDPYRYGSSNRAPFRSFVSVYTRRPASRMGVSWVFRKAFHDAFLRTRGYEPSGADTSSPEASRVLTQVMNGEIPLRIQARTGPDIETAFRLCKEFGVSFTLEDPIEAWKKVDLLASTEVPVIFGPIFDVPSGILSGTNESRQSRLHTVRDLASAGVPLALSAQDLRGEEGLARQAMLAIRHGVTPAEAMRMVTFYPAQLLGIDKEVGTLEEGKRADLVIWSGTPFSSLSRIEKVIHGGSISFNRS